MIIHTQLHKHFLKNAALNSSPFMFRTNLILYFGQISVHVLDKYNCKFYALLQQKKYSFPIFGCRLSRFLLVLLFSTKKVASPFFPTFYALLFLIAFFQLYFAQFHNWVAFSGGFLHLRSFWDHFEIIAFLKESLPILTRLHRLPTKIPKYNKMQQKIQNSIIHKYKDTNIR